MTAIAYPATLPVPQAAPIQSTERRAIAPDGGPYEVRALQRDRHAIQRITLPPLNEADAAVFQAWWEDDLFFGGAWFAATWPLPQGMAAGVRRFMAPPHWELLRSPQGNYWRITFDCEVRGRGELPELVIEDCDLLLHFDEADPVGWRDFSPFRRALTVSPGVGTIVGDASVGEFGRGALVTNPSAGTNADVAHPLLSAVGPIHFGAADFVIMLSLDIFALPGESGNSMLVTCYSAGVGWIVQLSTNDVGNNTTMEFSFALASGIEVVHGNVDVTGLSGKHRFLCSRKGRVMSTYLDEERVSTSLQFEDDEETADSDSDSVNLFCLPTTPGHRIAGYAGGMDEVYVNHGPTCGIDETSYTRPAAPLSASIPIRTQLGLD